ncbi:putative transcription factor interactor and regulator CCHC(Zn) family [Helianthus annuus]|nr:putative transcription factor interactor and regulator CCHC(Zn) family [Helianthus annuus]
MSGMGEPKLMDKLTLERCANQTGKLGFARVLVDVKASCNLPSEVEVAYPNRVTNLKVSYQWKPPICSHCVVFGHSFAQCKNKPQTGNGEGVKGPAVGVSGDGINRDESDQNPGLIDKGKGVMGKDDDGFETVIGKNKRQQYTNQGKFSNKGQNAAKSNPQGGQQVIANSGSGKEYSNNNGASCSKPKAPESKSQQNSTSGPKKAANQAPKNTQKLAGFNFTRAVQGRSVNKVSGLENNAKNTPGSAVNPAMNTYNRFSVLDVQESVKQGTLVADSSDLYPSENISTEKCTVNRQNVIDPGRVLPSWS